MNYLFVGAIYIGYGFTFMMETMWLNHGILLTLVILFITWANDTSAYFVGKRWGQRKLWPSISPKKTIEGSIAGIIAGLFISLLFFNIFPELEGTMIKAIGLGLFVTVVGQIGDLVESAWKRTIGVKDSGSILPGHGGLFDRFDSLLFVFIVLYTFGVLG
jgi:phosphatidate cytidylyltransferase